MTGLPPSPLAMIRRFHVTPDGSTPPVGVLPAALEPFRDASRVSYTWPLVVTTDGAHPTFTPLADTLATAAPARSQLLRDNLVRVERMVRAQGVGVPLAEVLTTIRPALQDQLQLHEGPAAQLDEAWRQMIASLPSDATLLGYDASSLVGLLKPVLARRHRALRTAMKQQMAALAAELEVLLPRTSADELEKEIGHGGRFLDPGALAGLVGTTRPEVGDARRTRIRRLHTALKAPLALPAMSFETSLADAVTQFDALSNELCRAVAAMHGARLELEGGYEEDRHDAVLQSLDWRALSREQLGLLPAVVAVLPAADLARQMGELTSVLLSGRPVHVVALVDPAADPARAQGWRLELAYLGIGLRQVWVQQSCVSRPEHLVAGFEEALRSRRAALHVVAAPPEGTAIHPWLVAGSAIEGRAQPLFRYDPSQRAFADRVDFSDNPAPERDWPEDQGGSAFTFAHYALLHDALRGHFLRIPPGLEDEDLVSLDDWLGLAPDEAARKVPVIDAVGADGDQVELALSRELAFAARDRQAYWRSLQELAGIHNAWAARAAADAAEQTRAQADAELEALRAEHAQLVEEVRSAAASEAMRKLTEVLLGGELLAAPVPVQAPDNGVSQPGSEAPPAAQAEAAVVEDDEDDLEITDPYIDTVLCTSCNECVNLNPKLFVYDANKQALIGDPDGGSFQELVMAAEVCPARCIHPGKPRNPNEAGVDALVAKLAELGV